VTWKYLRLLDLPLDRDMLQALQDVVGVGNEAILRCAGLQPIMAEVIEA
jgi:hypothetical protein